jgi:hypothetical protein
VAGRPLSRIDLPAAVCVCNPDLNVPLPQRGHGAVALSSGCISSHPPEEDTMRRRIYWLIPDLISARQTMDDLLLARISERHIHFVGREGADMSGLHAANVLQTSDIVRAAQAGLVTGGGVGAVAGAVVAVLLPIVGDSPQWGMVAVLAVAGALFGAWTASMIGVSAPSQRLSRFVAALDHGWYLLMVDVPRGQVTAIEARLQLLHPEAQLEGVEPNIPAFP